MIREVSHVCLGPWANSVDLNTVYSSSFGYLTVNMNIMYIIHN